MDNNQLIFVAIAGAGLVGSAAYYMMSPKEEKPNTSPFSISDGAKGASGGSRRFKNKRNKSKRR